jgi:hypothetical protein
LSRLDRYFVRHASLKQCESGSFPIERKKAMQPIQPNPRRKAMPLWKQDVVASSTNKVMCKCGAFYVPVKAKNQPGGLHPVPKTPSLV